MLFFKKLAIHGPLHMHKSLCILGWAKRITCVVCFLQEVRNCETVLKPTQVGG